MSAGYPFILLPGLALLPGTATIATGRAAAPPVNPGDPVTPGGYAHFPPPLTGVIVDENSTGELL